MKIRRSWLILTLISACLYIALIFLNHSTSGNSDLLQPSNISTGMQNFSMGYDAVRKITLVGTYQNKLIAFDDTGKKIWEFASRGPFRELKVDSKNRRVYAGNEDRNLYILDIDSGKLIRQINVRLRIYSIDISGDSSMIAVSAGVSAVKHYLILYDGNGNQVFMKDVGVTSQKVAFSNDNSGIILGTNRAELLLFDLQGNQKFKTKLNYEITGMQVLKDLKQIAVLTKNTTYYLLDEQFGKILSSTYYGEGMSLTASSDLQQIGIGSREGDFYMVDRSGKLLYTKKLENSVTSILMTDQKTLVTGLGDFIYELDNDRLSNIVFIRRMSSILNTLVYLFPVLIVFFAVMAFKASRAWMRRFFRIIAKYRTAYFMLLPTFSLLLLFNYYPVIIAFIRSFTDWNIHQSSIREISFIGLDNFKKMITEGYFLIGVKNLLLIIVTGFIKVLTVPILVAELVFLLKDDRMKYWFRFLFVLPMVVPGIVNTLMWQRIYDPTIGLLNNVLASLGLESLQRSWLGDPQTAIWAIIFMGFPFINSFAFLVYYGGLIDIPSSLFEAAKADGSNGWWNFTRIHLPLITPQIKMLIILTFIGAVQDFSNIFILTGGGPGVSTYVPGLELYYNATRFGQYGYASALGLVMFIAILGGTIANMRMKVNSEYND